MEKNLIPDNSDKNKDFTEVLGFKDKLAEIEDQSSENMTDTQVNYYKKMNIMFDYREQLFNNHLIEVNEKSYIELNVINLYLFFILEKYA